MLQRRKKRRVSGGRVAGGAGEWEDARAYPNVAICQEVRQRLYIVSRISRCSTVAAQTRESGSSRQCAPAELAPRREGGDAVQSQQMHPQKEGSIAPPYWSWFRGRHGRARGRAGDRPMGSQPEGTSKWATAAGRGGQRTATNAEPSDEKRRAGSEETKEERLPTPFASTSSVRPSRPPAKAFRPAFIRCFNSARSCSRIRQLYMATDSSTAGSEAGPMISLTVEFGSALSFLLVAGSPFSALTPSLRGYTPTAVAWSSYSATNTRTASKSLGSTTRRPSPPPLPPRRHLQLLLLRYRASKPTFAS